MNTSKALLINSSAHQLHKSKSNRDVVNLQASFDTGHGESVNDAKMDYCGTKLATASSDRTVRIFSVDHETGGYHRLAELTGYAGPVWQLAWSHPKFGNLLASASYDGRIIIWKEADTSPDVLMKSRWNAVFDEQVHQSSVNTVARCAPNFGAMLAAGSSDGSISILTFSDLDCWTTLKISKSHDLGCQTVSWSPVAKRLASGGNDYAVKIWSFNEEDEWVLDQTLRSHSDWVFSVEWSPLVEILVSAGRDGRVLLWSQVEEPEVPQWNHRSSYTSVSMSQCSDSSDMWTSRVLQVYDKGPFTVGWDPMGHFLCVTGKDNDEIYLWKHCNGDTWQCVSKPAIDAPKKPSKNVSFVNIGAT